MGRRLLGAVEAVLGDEISKLFRKPLEVSLGTLLVAFAAVGITGAIVVLYLERATQSGERAGLMSLGPARGHPPHGTTGFPAGFPDDGNQQGAISETSLQADAGLWSSVDGGELARLEVIAPNPQPPPAIRHVQGPPNQRNRTPPAQLRAETGERFVPPDITTLRGKFFVQIAASMRLDAFLNAAEHLRETQNFDNILRLPHGSGDAGEQLYSLLLGPYPKQKAADEVVNEIHRSYQAKPLNKFPDWKKLQLPRGFGKDAYSRTPNVTEMMAYRGGD